MIPIDRSESWNPESVKSGRTQAKTALTGITGSTAEGETWTAPSEYDASTADSSADIGFLNKRRRQWFQSASSIRQFEDKQTHDLGFENDVMFLVMRLDDTETEPIIIGASHNYIRELEFFRDEIVGYHVSHFLSKNQPEAPLWVDCLNWNLVYEREQGRELHVAQAGATFNVGKDVLILACGTPVAKVLGELDLTIHRKLKSVAHKMTANEAFMEWAVTEYNQFVKDDLKHYANRAAPIQHAGLQAHNTFLSTFNRKPSLMKMLEKSTVSSLDLHIPEGKVREYKTITQNCKTYDDIPAGEDGPLVRPKNIGSISHPGCKKACQFYFFSFKGCNKGFQCEFCHEGHVSNRKAKAKAWLQKQAEQERQQAARNDWWSQNDAVPIESYPHMMYPPRMSCSNCQNCGGYGQSATQTQIVWVPRQVEVPRGQCMYGPGLEAWPYPDPNWQYRQWDSDSQRAPQIY